MAYQIAREQQLNCDLDTAWKFFSSPHNLARITPADMRCNVISRLPDDRIYEGMVIDYTISPVLGLPMKWRTVITQVTDKKNFTDFQQKGPYKLWSHFHEFIPNEQGVLMKDTVDYELPLGVIGSIAHSLFVKRKLEYIFGYRYQVLDNFFNSKENPE